MIASSIGIPKFYPSSSNRFVARREQRSSPRTSTKKIIDETEDGSVLDEFKEKIDFPEVVEGK